MFVEFGVRTGRMPGATGQGNPTNNNPNPHDFIFGLGIVFSTLGPIPPPADLSGEGEGKDCPTRLKERKDTCKRGCQGKRKQAAGAGGQAQGAGASHGAQAQAPPAPGHSANNAPPPTMFGVPLHFPGVHVPRPAARRATTTPPATPPTTTRPGAGVGAAARDGPDAARPGRAARARSGAALLRRRSSRCPRRRAASSGCSPGEDEGGKAACAHTFHPACLASAQRARGWWREPAFREGRGEGDGEVESLCITEGRVPRAAWLEGSI
ncbi:hypothetical protein B0H10DRAFT_2447615 [Mycena sp. CBHHK59/15]|nr:hypothetical protein B0H10DRAFT_2447615 [Mycena sp. CBHHK59/15]